MCDEIPAGGGGIGEAATVTASEHPGRSAASGDVVHAELGLDIDSHGADRYEIAGEHGRGGIGRVSRARDRQIGRDVAVKELLVRSHHAEARFLREALITGRLEHPGIVPIHEIGRRPDGKPFYSMKMIKGRTLEALARAADSAEDRLMLLPNVIAVADAIAYAHSKRVIHRDLKPSNIIVGEFGETVVVDWGLAKDLTESNEEVGPLVDPYRSPADIQLTLAGQVVGTPAYMSPEQARGEDVDERVDVYAIGALVYELLTGEPPHRGSSVDEILQSARAAEPPRLIGRVFGIRRDRLFTRRSDDLVAIVGKAMAPDPEARYPSAKELAEDLKRYRDGLRVLASRDSLFRTSSAPDWSDSLLAVSGGIMLGVAIPSYASVAVLAYVPLLVWNWRRKRRRWLRDEAGQRLLPSEASPPEAPRAAKTEGDAGGS